MAQCSFDQFQRRQRVLFGAIIHRICKKAKFHHILVWAECVMQDLLKKSKHLPFCSGELRPVRQM